MLSLLFLFFFFFPKEKTDANNPPGAVAIPTSFGSSQVKRHRQQKGILTKVSCLEIITTNNKYSVCKRVRGEYNADMSLCA